MILGGKRYCGKTTELIKLSNQLNIHIVVLNYRRKDLLKYMAKKINIKIPEPIVIKNLFEYQTGRQNEFEKGILIDDVEDVLSYLFKSPIIAMSSSQMLIEMPTHDIRGKNHIPELILSSEEIRNVLNYYKK